MAGLLPAILGHGFFWELFSLKYPFPVGNPWNAAFADVVSFALTLVLREH